MQSSKGQKERFAAAAGLFRVTENALSKRRFWTRLERLVERSDMPLRTVELAYLMVGAGLIAAMLATVTGRGTMVALAMLVAGAAGPLGVVLLKATRRRRRSRTSFLMC